MNLIRAQWRKSSYSANETACVEVAPTSKTTGVRDSKNRLGGALLVARPCWADFVTAIKTGGLTR